MELLQRLRRQASQCPGQPALSDGRSSLSLAALVEAVDEFAHWLRGQSIGTLGLHADNSPAWVIADLAARAAGIVRVPLPPFFSLAQQQHLLTQAGIDAVLVDNALTATRLALSQPQQAPGALTLWRRTEQRTEQEAVDTTPALPAGCAKITFTSGSTGSPKGVCLSDAHLDRVGAALAQRLEHVGCHRHLCLLPLATLLENVAGVEVPLRLGAEVILLHATATGLLGSSSLDVTTLTAAIDRHQPNSLILLPQLLLALVHAAQQGWTPPPSLRFCAVGGARVAPRLLEQARALGLPAYEGYGLSECGSVVALNVPGADRIGSVGKPLSHAQVNIDHGEIVVTGNGFLGYLGDAATDDELARVVTGDLGHLDADGFLHVDGRRKNLIISSFGRNIAPEWVESELLRDGTLQQAVLFGEARPWCGALLYASPTISDSQIEAHVAAINRELPDYARVQRWLRLPQPLSADNGLLTANGRPRRADIAATYTSAIDTLYALAAANQTDTREITL